MKIDMTKYKSIILLWAVACLTACTQTPPEVKALRAEVEANLTQAKVSLWNCPYHNSRLVYELLHRLK
jgi:hypothetical protein